MKKRVLCFGDSNTWGYDAVTGGRYDEDTRWTALLQKSLGSDYTVIEEGHNGRTTVWDDPIENRLAGLTYLWPCMDSQSPIDLIVIMLGTNDTKCYFGTQAKSIADGAGRLVETAQKSKFGRCDQPPKVLLVAPIRVRDAECFEAIFGTQAEKKSEQFSVQFKRVADEFNCEFMDASEFADPSPVDGIHLDEKGHAAFAIALEKKIREIIG